METLRPLPAFVLHESTVIPPLLRVSMWRGGGEEVDPESKVWTTDCWMKAKDALCGSAVAPNHDDVDIAVVL